MIIDIDVGSGSGSGRGCGGDKKANKKYRKFGMMFDVQIVTALNFSKTLVGILSDTQINEIHKNFQACLESELLSLRIKLPDNMEGEIFLSRLNERARSNMETI